VHVLYTLSSTPSTTIRKQNQLQNLLFSKCLLPAKLNACLAIGKDTEMLLTSQTLCSGVSQHRPWILEMEQSKMLGIHKPVQLRGISWFGFNNLQGAVDGTLCRRQRSSDGFAGNRVSAETIGVRIVAQCPGGPCHHALGKLQPPIVETLYCDFQSPMRSSRPIEDSFGHRAAHRMPSLAANKGAWKMLL